MLCRAPRFLRKFAHSLLAGRQIFRYSTIGINPFWARARIIFFNIPGLRFCKDSSSSPTSQPDSVEETARQQETPASPPKAIGVIWAIPALVAAY
jgi:hypothetical protein